MDSTTAFAPQMGLHLVVYSFAGRSVAFRVIGRGRRARFQHKSSMHNRAELLKRGRTIVPEGLRASVLAECLFSEYDVQLFWEA